MTRSFSVNWDYRCPFARNAHEHVVAGLKAGADWDVEFVPFSLSQVHVDEGGTPVWEDPAKARDLLAMRAGLVVRDTQPERFLDVHLALFSARHGQGRDLRDPEVVRSILAEAGADAGSVMAALDEGAALDGFRKEHEASADENGVWGVPTFVVGERAAFARLMTRPEADATASVALIERVVDAVGGWSELNELKHTTLSR
ncbi:MAG TPA: DsbA family protein [Acidimicrobiales bacterium]|nr:DsbA family protein [Acidimicrobiales bacterium]